MKPHRRELGGSFQYDIELPNDFHFTGEIEATAYEDDNVIQSLWVNWGIVSNADGDVIWEKERYRNSIGAEKIEFDLIRHLDEHYWEDIISRIKESN